MGTKKRKKTERLSPEDQALKQIFHRLDKEVSFLEARWIDVVSDARGKIQLVFRLYRTSENIKAVRETLRSELGQKVFKEKEISAKLKILLSRVRCIRKAVPPLVIDESCKAVG